VRYVWVVRRTKADINLNSITFEPVPSDFAILKIHTLPPTGGDTLWASAYEVYDKLVRRIAEWRTWITAVTHLPVSISVALIQEVPRASTGISRIESFCESRGWLWK
jgi:hypothetical protein